MDHPDLYVVARFLDTLYKSTQPMKKTNIQMRVGLNYTRFAEYLDWMQLQGLVQKSQDGETELFGLRRRDSTHIIFSSDGYETHFIRRRSRSR